MPLSTLLLWLLNLAPRIAVDWGDRAHHLFRMEQTQCLYENEVEFNLSESGVLPLRVEEVLQSSKESADFLALGLKYPDRRFRATARVHCPVVWHHPDHVLVTNGGSEANFTALWGLLEKGRSRGRHAAQLSADLGALSRLRGQNQCLLSGGRQREREGAVGPGH